MAWDPIKEAKKWINKIKNEGDRAVNTVKNESNKAVNTVKNEGNKAVNTVKNEANKAKKEIEATAKQAEKFVGQIPKELESALGKFVDELAKALSKKGLQAARDLVREAKDEMDSWQILSQEEMDEIDELGFDVGLGPITLGYAGFYSRADDLITALDSFVNKPPAFRRSQIIPLVNALAPTTIDLGIDIKLAALVATSDALSVGFKLKEIRPRLFTRLGDRALKAMGVPE